MSHLGSAAHCVSLLSLSLTIQAVGECAAVPGTWIMRITSQWVVGGSRLHSEARLMSHGLGVLLPCDRGLAAVTVG